MTGDAVAPTAESAAGDERATATRTATTGPRLGLGLAAIGRPAYITAGRGNDLGDPADRSVEAMRARAHELLDVAWDNGIRYVDVARSYGAAEEFLGTWLARHPDRRRSLTVGSKWGYEYVGDWRMDAPVHERKDHSLRMFERQWPQTLRALGGAQPDLYLIHSVTPESSALHDSGLLSRLRRLADTGVSVGISTSGPHQGDVLAEALALVDCPFRAVQATWNLLEQSASPMLSEAHSANWLVVVKEVLANGRLTDPLATGSAVHELAVADGQSTEAFAIGAALDQPWSDVVLTGAVLPRQLLTNVAARAPHTEPDQLAALTVPPASYWADRSRLEWS